MGKKMEEIEKARQCLVHKANECREYDLSWRGTCGGFEKLSAECWRDI